MSRGTVVTVFEQLQAEGYLRGRVGAGTWVNEVLADRVPRGRSQAIAAEPRLPPPLAGLTFPQPARPFRAHEPALAEFPLNVWAAGRQPPAATLAAEFVIRS